MIILDTSALIEITRGNDKGKKIIEIIKEDNYATTSINMHELLILTRKEEKSKFREFFNSLRIFPYSRKCVEKSVNIEKALMQSGNLINRIDILIGSICLAQEASILTLDLDFNKIKGLKVMVIKANTD